MEFESINRLSKDIKEASYILSNDEARFLVDAYYQMQDNRIRTNGQIRSMTESGEPNAVLNWLAEQDTILEKQIARALDAYSASKEIGKWMRSQKGIGPVIASGLMAHIDINKAPTAGHIWSYAGLSNNPEKEWKKGEKRPYNATLKTLCWKVGESLVKVSGHDDAFYGKIYKERKELEISKNDNKEYADQAKAKLEKFNIGKNTDAYKFYSVGLLPPAHIHARAKRYAVKMFLSHMHQVWRELEGLPCPEPYAIAHMGHAHMIEPNT